MYDVTDCAFLTRCLQDAGCDDAFIQAFLQVPDNGRNKEQLRLLALWRCRLLEKIHAEQKKLDALDYLRYMLKKQSEKFT